MKFVTYIKSELDLRRCAELPEVREVLIEPADFAAEGELSLLESCRLACVAKDLGLEAALVADRLVEQSKLQSLQEGLKRADLSGFRHIRVQDVGLAEFVRAELPELFIQLIVETGSHNTPALYGWSQYFGPRLSRLVVSIELPEEKLIELCQVVTTPIEILGAGRILLFYSPRRLLSVNFERADRSGLIEVESSSPDSHLRPFPTVESEHGTRMYLDKDQFILERLEALKSAGLAAVRIDLRHLGAEQEATAGLTDLVQAYGSGQVDPKRHWPRKTLAPFFRSNNTTKQFSKLRPQLRPVRDGDCVGEVVSCESKTNVTFLALNTFAVGEEFDLLLPTQERIPVTLRGMENIAGQEIERASAGSLIVTQWLRKASPGSLLLRKASR